MLQHYLAKEETIEDNAQVLCVCNTVQLLQRSRPFSPEPCPQKPRAEHIDYKI